MLCRDGTCCRLLIIITRFHCFCSYFPIVLLAHVLDLIGGRSILSNHTLAELAWAQRFHVSWYFV